MTTLDEEAWDYGFENKFKYEEVTCQAQLDGLLMSAYLAGAKRQREKAVKIAYAHYIPGHAVGTAVVEGIVKDILHEETIKE